MAVTQPPPKDAATLSANATREDAELYTKYLAYMNEQFERIAKLKRRQSNSPLSSRQIVSLIKKTIDPLPRLLDKNDLSAIRGALDAVFPALVDLGGISATSELSHDDFMTNSYLIDKVLEAAAELHFGTTQPTWTSRSINLISRLKDQVLTLEGIFHHATSAKKTNSPAAQSSEADIDRRQHDNQEVASLPLPIYNNIMTPVSSPFELYKLLTITPGIKIGSLLTKNKLQIVSQTAFNAIITGLVNAPETLRDPVTGLELPPKPREIDFQCRGKGPSGKRMSFAEYLGDEVIGWGTYTKHHLLASFWINELDPHLYAALNYQAKKEADEADARDPAQRLEIQDAFFLRHGILTPGHLINPPAAYRWQAKVLAFIKKLQTPLPMGRRTDAGERS